MTDARVAIVTGASRGLGRAIAVSLAGTGAVVVPVAREAVALEETARLCREAGAPDTWPRPADLTDPSEPERIAGELAKRFGRIDILINVAGDTRRGHFLELSDDDHLSGFSLKYHATVRLCRACWPALKAARGVIVNIAGVGALTPEAEFTIGGPVNAALLNLSKALAKVAPDRVRVNSLCPGHIVTDRLRRRIETLAAKEGVDRDEAQEILRRRLGLIRFGHSEDIAKAVCYLCSDAAGYVTGTNLVVDGGATPGL